MARSGTGSGWFWFQNGVRVFACSWCKTAAAAGQPETAEARETRNRDTDQVSPALWQHPTIDSRGQRAQPSPKHKLAQGVLICGWSHSDLTNLVLHYSQEQHLEFEQNCFYFKKLGEVNNDVQLITTLMIKRSKIKPRLPFLVKEAM